MRADELLAAIRQRLGAADDEQLGHRLCNSDRPAAWREKAELSADDVADLVAELEGGLVRGSDLVQRLLKLVERDSRREAAPLLGVSYQTLANWTENPAFTTQDIARILKKLGEGFTAQAHRTAVEPLVEFYPIDECDSRRGKSLELFSIEVDGSEHRYRAGLKEALDSNNGVYVFYDSRGHAIYAGKAVSQSLWKEMNLAFNRERGDLQMIRRVAHPTRNEEYRPAGEVDRQIRDETVLLSELAEYFSAYRVTEGFIGEVESLLVRAFANDLLNKRMEKFDVQRNGR